MTIEEREKRAQELFHTGYNCSQSVAMTFADVIGLPEEEIAKLASGFGAGMGRMREVCGAVSGMTMVAGAITQKTPINDINTRTAVYAQIQEMAHEFKELNGSIICRELLGLSKPEGSPVPQERTLEYYKKRPCGELCGIAARIVATKLQIK